MPKESRVVADDEFWEEMFDPDGRSFTVENTPQFTMNETPDITRATAVEKLKELQRAEDGYERAHEAADEALCDLLRTLGYSDVVAEWTKVPKWYS